MSINSLKHIFGMFLLGSLMGTKNESGKPMFRGSSIGGWNPMYSPKRGKFKGYMRDKNKFNKNK